MVEQDVLGDALLGGLQEFGHRAGVGNDAVGAARLEGIEVVALEVLGATCLRVVPVDIDHVEVVGPDGKLAEDVLHSLADEARYALVVLGLDLPALGIGDAKHAHGNLSRQGPVHPRTP